MYYNFIHELAQKEQTLTVQYHIVQKDGTIMYVSDTATSRRLENGTLVGYSVLIDITALKEERNSFAIFLNQVYTKDSPMSGEISVLRFDGTKARLYGWVTKFINEQEAITLQEENISLKNMNESM